MSKQRIEKNVQIIAIDKTEAFKYKTTFFAGKDAKTGHKNAETPDFSGVSGECIYFGHSRWSECNYRI